MCNIKNFPVFLTDKYILIMLGIFPLFCGFSGYANLTFSKYLFFVIATLTWIFALIIYTLNYGFNEIFFNIPRILACIFIIIVLLSTTLSDYTSNILIGTSRYDGTLTLVLYASIFIGVSLFAVPRKRYIYALIFSVSICSVVAIIQYQGLNPLNLFPDGLNYFDKNIKYSGEFLGTIGNTNVLAAFLILALGSICAYASRSKSWLEKCLFFVCTLIIYTIYIADVSSGTLAALTFFALYFVYLFHEKFSKKAFILFLAIIFILTIFALIYIYFCPSDSGTLYEISEILHGNIDDSFGSSRVLIWRKCLELVPENFLFGGGPDTISLRLDVSFSRYVEETGSTISNSVDNAHNEYLNYLVNIGFLGLLSYLSIIIYSIYTGLKQSKNILILSLTGGLIAYFVQSFFGLGLVIIVPLVWIFMGLICGNFDEVNYGNS